MRCFIGLVVALGLLLASLPAQAQSGYDRRGGDYTKFEIKTGDPALCAARCERDARCHAWSFSYPRTENTAAICWLKNKVTPRVEAKCCVSGVRGAGVIEPHGPIEYSIDRLGGDLRYFDMKDPDPDGAACRAACDAEGKCRAWTYVRPGYISVAPRCYLKDKITRPRHKPCCISGVVR
ncbi:MAG: PAN domain-containing protein [Pseudolabrys sp.]